MKLVLLFGPQAVGKMTVGHELEKVTKLKLFHNHMTIDLVTPFFEYGSDEGRRLVKLFRSEIFQTYAKSDQYGMIFTYVWAFNYKEDWEFVEGVCQVFEKEGAEIYFVELESDLETRLKRNTTSHRLDHKPSKRNIKWSENDVKTSMEKYRLNSEEGELKRENYLRINNENLNPDEVAEQIKYTFNL
ncbi:MULTISPECIES: AAA family ATPase [Fictibacillus]|uniref:AAA family ATPase n=1 Tax=Fictibacillus TaxID=1329200 RepID=UPI0018CE91BB|nr:MULTISPECIES: AAA family ATPase [unclassified Fictibacillus]MBH0160634.1 AAA family ATPase [Fictibacillus sp. 26RED30]MBH0173428.1 AAA family ATPase [Fictibacillus sp. 23RED33]